MEKNILAVVPARGGSKGIKLKNLRKVDGISLVGHVGRVIMSIPEIDLAIISSDHPEIIKEALNVGLEAPFVRPKALSGDLVSDVEVLTHALLEVEKQRNEKYDIILMLQPTSPMRNSNDVKETVRKLIEGKYDSVFTVSETDSKGHPLKQFVLDGEMIKYFDEKGAEIIARQQLKPTFHKNGLVYAITRECLLKQNTLLGINASFLVTKRSVVNIDTEYDIELAEYIISKKDVIGC